MTRTKLYLDVDGVLNATHSSKAWKTEPEEFKSDSGFIIQYQEKLLQDLDNILLAFNVELVWLTTWCFEEDVLNDLVPKFNGHLTGGRVLPTELFRTKRGYLDGPIDWKYNALLKDQEESPSPFIWIDDAEVPWFGSRLETALPDTSHMSIGPYSEIGITPTHINLIIAFLEVLDSEPKG